MASWIQNHILLELTRHQSRRYSQLRPRDVEGNLFMYHLKGLVKDGLVEKIEQAYTLSAKGLQYAGTLSLASGQPRLQPKILTAVVCKNNKGEHLFVRWRRQPNIGLVSFVHGMMHYGKTAFAMAAQELAEKAGLQADLTHRGEVCVIGMRGSEVDRHMLVHLFEAKNVGIGPQNKLRPEVCEHFWAPLNSIKPEDFVPGFYEIAQLIAPDSQPLPAQRPSPQTVAQSAGNADVVWGGVESQVATTQPRHIFEEITVTVD